MRYTEIRLARIAHELLSDLDKETVEFGLNYDETETQPLTLPARAPNLLVNGSTGIAVGMATNVPPHNLAETIDATLALIGKDPDITIAGLMEHLPGPDFPTAGIINGRGGIRQAYATGRGRVEVRARTEIEHRQQAAASPSVVNQLPYQVNKARLMEKIADLVKHKRLEGISAMRDESDKSGMRMVIELKARRAGRGGAEQPLPADQDAGHVRHQHGGPRQKSAAPVQSQGNALDEFVKHRREVVTRRTLV